MVEQSVPWPGDVLMGSPGDAGPYSDDVWDNIWGMLFGSEAAPYGNRGVIRNWQNELEVTNPGIAGRVDVDTGAALVHGKFYRNTAMENIVGIPPAPGGVGGTWREDTILLRSHWTLQTIRIYRHQNPDNEATYDTPLSTDGTVWYIPLAAVRIDNGGVITQITDLREYVSNLMQPKQIWTKPEPFAGAVFFNQSYHTVVYFDAINEIAGFEFIVPNDFKSLVSAWIYYFPSDTGTWDWTINMGAGGCGENLNAHSDSCTADGEAVTALEIACLDVSACLDGISAGDLAGVRIKVDAMTVAGIFIGALVLNYK